MSTPNAGLVIVLGMLCGGITADVADAQPCPGGPRATAAQASSRATGRYQGGGGGGKEDSVQQLRIPVNPSGDAKSWLDAHNQGLLRIIRSQYGAQDMNTFAARERQRCTTGSIYCQLAFRQQVIAVLVSP